MIGINPSGVPTAVPDTYTSVQGAVTPHMERKNAVAQRRRRPKTPLVADRWEVELRLAGLFPKYPLIPVFIQRGANAGIPQIKTSFTPLNRSSTETLSLEFNNILQAEFNKGRYVGPFSKEEVEAEIGPFQSSPLSLIPKPGKPGKFCLIQNLSYLHTNNPVASINAHLKSDDFPCTWGTFRTVCNLIRILPPGTQAAVRDIAEAYRIIPLHENQWAGVVVRVSNDPELFAINTCNSFGCTTAGGLFGLFADALADIIRAKGIGPALKWVDDFLFFRIPNRRIEEQNKLRQILRDTIQKNGGTHQTGGRLWYKGRFREETGFEHFAEDLTFPLRILGNHHHDGITYPFDFNDIDEVTRPMGIPWELSKDVPFSTVVPFIGLEWDLADKRVSLPKAKRGKYIQAIQVWRAEQVHTLEDVQKLHGKLLWACFIIPRGKAYLTNLEKMMGTALNRPFTPRHSPSLLSEDLRWWHKILSRPSLSREIPGNRHIQDVAGYSDASSSVGIGVVIGHKWRAWRLLPGWQTDGRDIGWAEAVGLELLVRSVLRSRPWPGFKVFGDNIGVVEGWWAGRSRNTETNFVFRRVHDVLDTHDSVLITQYVKSAQNPADGPSRGLYPPRNLLLPQIPIPIELRPFVSDFDVPYHPREKRATQSVAPQPKTTLSTHERLRRKQAEAEFAEQQHESAQTHATN